MVVRPILTSQTAEISPSLSPDGKTVAYAWNGKYVAFGRRKQDKRQLIMVPALGGMERVVVEEVFSPKLVSYNRPWFAWNPDGKQLVYSVVALGEAPGPVSIDPESGTRKRLISSPDTVFADSSPVFLGDGGKLAFIRFRNTMAGSVEVLTLNDMSMRSYPVDMPLSSLIVIPGRDELMLTSYDSGLRRLSLGTGAVHLTSPILRAASSPSFSADGRRGAYQLSTRDSNIWHAVLDTAGRASTPEQLIASTALDDDPRYFHSGEQILFTSNRGGSLTPWIADRQGRNAQVVSLNGRLYGSPSLSPDDRQIAYDVRIQGDAQVFAAATTGGSPRQLTTDKFENIVPSWAHDGKWIYYCSNRTGRQEIWRVLAGCGFVIAW